MNRAAGAPAHSCRDQSTQSAVIPFLTSAHGLLMRSRMPRLEGQAMDSAFFPVRLPGVALPLTIRSIIDLRCLWLRLFEWRGVIWWEAVLPPTAWCHVYLVSNRTTVARVFLSIVYHSSWLADFPLLGFPCFSWPTMRSVRSLGSIRFVFIASSVLQGSLW